MWRQYGGEIVLTREEFDMLEQSIRGIMRNMRMMEKTWKRGLYGCDGDEYV